MAAQFCGGDSTWLKKLTYGLTSVSRLNFESPCETMSVTRFHFFTFFARGRPEMGGRGVLRSLQALPKRERPAYRHYVELEKKLQPVDGIAAHERAALFADISETRLELARSIHQECGPAID